MKADSPHWVVMGGPATPAEAAALDRFRDLLPEDGITTAWVNLTFIDDNGRSAEVDVLLLTRAGFFVVELKGWHGTIRGNSQRWQHGPRNVENPWLTTDRKAKRLVELLRDHAPSPAARRTVPFLQSLVVLHGYESTVNLDARGRTGVVALDGYHVRAKPALKTFSAFLAEPPSNAAHLVDKVRATQIRALCDRADIRKTPKTRMVGDYVVADSSPIAEGPDWQDVLVDHPHLPGVRLRVRLYDVAAKASTSERQRIEQLARSELQITYGIKHEGIAVPSEFKKTDDGPALVFEHDDAELPLDAYLAGPGAELAFDERIALVQRLGEILRYAHQRHLIHRALSPQRVWVRPARNGLPHLAIRDWYFGQKVHSTDAATRWSAISAGLDDLLGVANPQDWIYFAPEARTSTQGLPGIPLDVFGCGALAYLILTGRPPADNLAQLEQKLTDTRALDPRAAVPGMPDGVADVIAKATSFAETDRPTSIVELLNLLRSAWDEVRRPEPDAERTMVDDPLEAQADDVVADRFIVVARRGEGSSGLALAVKDAESDDPEREVILKVARSAGADRRLADEAAVLRALDHRRIVRLIEGPFDVDDRTALLLTDAGKETLAARLAKEGRATLGQLQQFGGDLLDVMSYLDGKGIFHRDVKPANLGIAPDPGSRRPTLVLFDLSLASADVGNLESGTPGYLDPYLGRGRRQRYDRAAELYSVSATLFEMATGVLPWWPDGSARPLNPRDAPVVEPGSFEPAVAVPLTALFQRALNPDVKHRYSTADELAIAWQEVFASLDAREETAESNDALAEAAVADTPLERSGLSTRARSALARLDLATVGDLLAVHPARINTIRGLGEAYRKEIQRRIKQWRTRLAVTEEPVVVGFASGTERLLATLLDELASDDRAIVEAMLELDGAVDAAPRWPAAAEVAQKLHLTREQVVHAVDTAVTTWTKGKAPALPGVRDEAVRILAREGRVTTLPEPGHGAGRGARIPPRRGRTHAPRCSPAAGRLRAGRPRRRTGPRAATQQAAPDAGGAARGRRPRPDRARVPHRRRSARSGRGAGPRRGRARRRDGGHGRHSGRHRRCRPRGRGGRGRRGRPDRRPPAAPARGRRRGRRGVVRVRRAVPGRPEGGGRRGAGPERQARATDQ